MNIKKWFQLLCRRPGLFVICMSIWILPLFVIDFLRHPIEGSWQGHVMYLIFLIVILLISVGLNYLDLRFDYFAKLSFRLRILVLVVFYLLTMMVASGSLIAFGSFLWMFMQNGRLGYPGDDGGGSFVLCVIPSIVVYGVIGVFVAIISVMLETTRNLSE